MTDSITPIWEEFHARLHGFILGRVGDASAADDILQEVFLRVHTRIDTFQKGTHLQAWLYQITRHTIADYYRARKPDHALPKVLAGPERNTTDLFYGSYVSQKELHLFDILLTPGISAADAVDDGLHRGVQTSIRAQAGERVHILPGVKPVHDFRVRKPAIPPKEDE